MKSRFVFCYWPLAALLAYPAFQLIPWPAIGSITVDARATGMQLLTWSAFALLYFCIVELGRRIRNRWLLVAPLIVFAAAEAVLGLVQHFNGGPEHFAAGTYAEHSHFAGLMEMALPLAVAFPLLKPASFLLRSAPATLILLGLVYSYSRMGLAAAMLSLTLLVVCWRRSMQGSIGFRRAWAPLAVAALFVVLFAPSGLMDRFGRISSAEGFAHDAHLARWKATASLIAARPLFGSGLGAYRAALVPYNPSESYKVVNHADNDYLEFLAELGIVGFSLAACFLAVSLGRAISIYRRAGDPSHRLLALASLASVAALLMHSAVEFQLHVPLNALLFLWICGLHSGGGRAEARLPVVQKPMEVAA